MRKVIISAGILNYLIIPNAIAQGSNNIGGIIQPAGLNEPYGINDTSILKSQTEFTTRHRRIGTDTGIGSSFLQTTSPTSESSPALRWAVAPAAPQAPRLPRMPVSMYGNIEKTPALNNETNVESLTGMSRRLRSPALSSPISAEASSPSDVGLVTKKPLTIIEPLQQLNLHRTGGL